MTAHYPDLIRPPAKRQPVNGWPRNSVTRRLIRGPWSELCPGCFCAARCRTRLRNHGCRTCWRMKRYCRKPCVLWSSTCASKALRANRPLPPYTFETKILRDICRRATPALASRAHGCPLTVLRRMPAAERAPIGARSAARRVKRGRNSYSELDVTEEIRRGTLHARTTRGPYAQA